MGWFDAAALAARGVARRAGRALLTVLAVLLAATLLVALLTIAGTARTKVLGELAKGGPLAGIKVAAAEPDPNQIDNDNARPGDPKDLDDAALARIRALPGVRSVLPIVSTRLLVAPLPAPGLTVTPRDDDPPGGHTFADTAVGVDLRRAGGLPITVLGGRLPDPSVGTEVAVTAGYLKLVGVARTDLAKVIGTEVVVGAPRAFRGQGPLEQRIRGRWRQLRVVGVVAQEAASNADLLLSIDEVQAARRWSLSGGRLEDLGVPRTPYSALFVTASRLDQVGAVRNQITQVGYATQAPENLIATVQRYLRVVEIVLTGIGAIALVIASLGIANAMLAAVRERRREIGVLKAIGARDVDILRVFLLEAGVLGLVGGVLGTLAGWGVATAVATVVNRYLAGQGLKGVTLALPGWVAAGGVLGSVALALLAGTLPALRAARLPAREAVAGG